MGDIRKREASLPFRSIYGQEDSPASDAVPPIDDYTDIAAHGSYYFRSHGILVHVDAIDGRTSGASELTDRRADRIVDRDGTCLSTGEETELCIACHIIPHSKGDNVRC